MKLLKSSTLLLLIIFFTSLASGCGGGGDDGDGETVACNDGWISDSKDKQGACSSHGGLNKK